MIGTNEQRKLVETSYNDLSGRLCKDFEASTQPVFISFLKPWSKSP